MRVLRWTKACTWAVLLAPVIAHAAGYSIYEQGAAALGMAGAYVASAHDATAAFYNPAALTRLDGKQLSVGASWLNTHTSFAGEPEFPGFGVAESMKNGSFFPPHAYWTARFKERFAYGLGINAPFGLGVEWENSDQFTGRTRVTKATLDAVNTSASVAWAPDERWSFAAGLSGLFARVELNNISVVPSTGGQPINVSRNKLKSSYKPDLGWNLAVLGTPNKQWKFGVTYRSEVKVDVNDGDATFSQIPSGDPSFDAAVAAGLPKNQTVKTTLTFPASLSGGVAWNPRPDWTTEVDLVWTQWSAFEKLALRFDDPALNQDIVENYDDQIQIRAGAERRMEMWTARFGYYYDKAAAPTESVTPLLPDANRHGVTLGIGLPRGKWTIDAYNLFLFVQKRSTDGKERDGYNGTYKTYVNSLGATLAYHW